MPSSATIDHNFFGWHGSARSIWRPSRHVMLRLDASGDGGSVDKRQLYKIREGSQLTRSSCSQWPGAWRLHAVGPTSQTSPKRSCTEACVVGVEVSYHPARNRSGRHSVHAGMNGHGGGSVRDPSDVDVLLPRCCASCSLPLHRSAHRRMASLPWLDHLPHHFAGLFDPCWRWAR